MGTVQLGLHMDFRTELEWASHDAVVGKVVHRLEEIADLVTNADAWQVVARRCKVED